MKKLPGIAKATRSYEKWLARHMPLLEDDLRLKHQKMSESAFMFLRATYYRWVQLWDFACSDLQSSPNVLSVGDIHIENFGTWRDCDGRLIWGINDFDEAAVLPAALDIVRLAVSVQIAIYENSISVADPKAMTEAILAGYLGHCEHGQPGAYVLEEQNIWLRKIALNKLRDPEKYWTKFESLPSAEAKVFKPARRALSIAMPSKALDIKYFRRTAGLGSLGRPRVVAIAKWGDGLVCREAKRVAPPASYWARGRDRQKQINVMTIVRKEERVPDPFYHVRGKWTVRRLSPHCGKIELSSFSKEKTLLKLVAAMGSSIATIHAGSVDRKRLGKEMNERSKQIHKAIETMTDLTLNDWASWKKAHKKSVAKMEKKTSKKKAKA